MAQDVVVRFRADTTDFLSDTQKIIQQMQVLQEVLTGKGRGSLFTSQFGDLKTFISDMQSADARVQSLNEKLATLQKLRDRPQIRRGVTELSAQEQQITGLGPTTTRKAIGAETTATLAAGNDILKERERLVKNIEKVARQDADAAQAILQVSTARQFVEEKIFDVLSRQTDNRIMEERVRLLREQQRLLAAARVEVERQVAGQLGRSTGDKLIRGTTDTAVDITRINDQILRVQDLISRGLSTMNDSRIRGTERAFQLEERIRQLLADETNLVQKRTLLEDQNLRARQQGAFAADKTGAAGRLAEIDRLQAQTTEELFQVSKGDIDLVAPELAKQRQELLKNLQIQNRSEEVERRKFQILEKIRVLEQTAPRRGLVDTERFDPARLREQQLANLSGFERTLFNAFDDVGRRFRTALQFAISGAVIFGAQQLVREFAQAAIQVERTFADIESALEFDIDFARGLLGSTRRWSGYVGRSSFWRTSSMFSLRRLTRRHSRWSPASRIPRMPEGGAGTVFGHQDLHD